MQPNKVQPKKVQPNKQPNKQPDKVQPNKVKTMVQNRVILRHLAKIDFFPRALGLSHGHGGYLGHMEWSIKVTGPLHLSRQVLVFDH